MKIRILLSSTFVAFILILVACSENPIQDIETETLLTEQEILSKYVNVQLDDLYNYSDIQYPIHYTNQILQNDNTPPDNPVTDLGATLGRILFYDTNLSSNGTISCASCHQQNNGFTDSDQFSVGFEDGLTGAHSMRLGNAHLYAGESMFWDKRALTLEDQTTQPIQDAVEMGFDQSHGGLLALTEKMSNLEYYPILFDELFGDKTITEDRVQKALAIFIRSMASVDSKFDQGYAQVFQPGGQVPGTGPNSLLVDFPNFSEQENLGKRLFVLPPPQGGAGCAGCHQIPSFALSINSLSNGLDQGETVIFKSPSLKNVGLSGPYMHDGRFETLEQVVEHYDNGVRQGPALDNRLRMGPNPQNLNLDANEKSALVAFLNTLNDENLISDLKYSDPFIR